MTNTQTRAGKKLSAATKKQIDDAQDHLERAMERHKALGDQMDNIQEQRDDGDESMRADLADMHEDASDTHRALGRSLKACQRCLRTALKNTKPAPTDDDEEDDTETSAGDGNDNDQRSADLRRRKAELRALSQKS